MGKPDCVTDAKASLTLAKAGCEGSNEMLCDRETIKICMDCWQNNVATHGEDSTIAIVSGSSLAVLLKESLYGIIAKRLMSELVHSSKRVHGPDHDCTTDNGMWFQKIRERYVLIESEAGEQFFQIFRYEEGGKKCIVQCPVEAEGDSRKLRKYVAENSQVVSTKNMIPRSGTPVIYH